MRGKRALLLVALILAGCGGSSAPEAQIVTGPGFRFEAPGGWKVTRSSSRTTATHGSEFVQVATFRLLKPYNPSLFARVATELTARMGQVATQVNGTVSGNRTVTAAGIRSHMYEVRVDDHADEYTFVLRGLREYQLLCRRSASGSDAACKQLLSSFAIR